jgi:hypothetical protein
LISRVGRDLLKIFKALYRDGTPAEGQARI